MCLITHILANTEKLVMSNSSDAIDTVCLEMCECKIKWSLGLYILYIKVASVHLTLTLTLEVERLIVSHMRQ